MGKNVQEWGYILFKGPGAKEIFMEKEVKGMEEPKDEEYCKRLFSGTDRANVAMQK